MVGLVVASHGRLAAELVSTAKQIVGELGPVATCAVEPNSSPEELRERMRAAIDSVNTGDGVIVFADLIGGSPCTQSLTLCQQAHLEVITGVNLPMLLKAVQLRANGVPLQEFATQLTAYGQRTITCASEQLRKATAA